MSQTQRATRDPFDNRTDGDSEPTATDEQLAEQLSDRDEIERVSWFASACVVKARTRDAHETLMWLRDETNRYHVETIGGRGDTIDLLFK